MIIRRFVEPAIFAGVGLAASLAHFLAAVLLVEQVSVQPWIANIIAFAVAFPVSYFGHSFLTFSARAYGRADAVTGKSFRRFLTLAGAGFLLNQASVVLFVEQLGYPPRTVFGVTIACVAGILYLAGKFWAFRDRPRS